MITNISSLLTPTLMWSGITAIPAIEPALRIIMNVGLLISNRYQYHYKKTHFNPDLSFTKHSTYGYSEIIVTGLKLKFAIKMLDLAKNVLDVARQGNSKELTLRLKNSEIIHTVNQETFKLYSGTYRKLSEDFLTREGVCYSPELKEFKNTTIPDSFSEENFNRWTGYLNSDIYDSDDLNQVKEFVFPECFSEETLGLLNDYFARGEYALKHLDKNSLLEFFKLVDYLDMPAMEGDCVIPFLENILKNGQTSLSESELKEIKNSAILGAYSEKIKALCADIKQCKDRYNDVDFPKELADLDLEMNKIRKEILLYCLLFVVFGILPLYPLLLQCISPTSWILLKQAATLSGSVPRYIPSANEGLMFICDVFKMVGMYMMAAVTPAMLYELGSQILPTTTAIFRKTVNAIYNVALNILYAPIFVAKEIGKAILFTAKTLSKIPSIVQSMFAASKLAPI